MERDSESMWTIGNKNYVFFWNLNISWYHACQILANTVLHSGINQTFVFSCCMCSSGIEKIAWDASGERLAVSYKGGDDTYKGLIAIYDARRTPLISVSLM